MMMLSIILTVLQCQYGVGLHNVFRPSYVFYIFVLLYISSFSFRLLVVIFLPEIKLD